MTDPQTKKPDGKPPPNGTRPSTGTVSPEQVPLHAGCNSPESLVAILDALPEGAFLMAPDGILLACNQTLAERLGRTRSDLLGTNVFDLLDPANLETRRQAVARVLETGQPFQFEDERRGRIIAHSLNPVIGDQGRVVQIAVFGAVRHDVLDCKADVTVKRQGVRVSRGC